MHKPAAILGALAGASALALAPTAAAAQTDGAAHQATLGSLNGSGASGMAMVDVSGGQATVTVTISGASPGAPHAQHIHIGGQNVCPTGSADTDGDGFVSTPEGQPAYGEIQVSLTTEGDVGAGSGLAVDRMPVASSGGEITYERTFPLPDGVTEADVADGVIVSHGIADTSLGSDPSTYDGPDSPLMAGVPQEATLPAACGALTAAPAGGVQTGGGGTADAASSSVPFGLLIAGAGAAGAAGLVARRRATA